MKIGFVGLGKLGLPCAEVIAAKGHEVSGYDIVDVQTDRVQLKHSIKDCVRETEIVFVAVPTPHDPAYDGRAPTAHLEPKDFSYEAVQSVIQEANACMNTNQLLVLISTVLPGTIRNSLADLVTNTNFVYNPYLIAMGTTAWDMVNPDIVMIGTKNGNTNGDAEKLVNFYKTIMENSPAYEIGTWDECECIKVFYNTFISTKIGLVNMMQDVAEKQGNINVDKVTDALAKCHKRITSSAYMKAGMGDGGACHPRDNIALRYMAQKLDLGYDLFDSVMNAREQQAKNMAEKLVQLASAHDLPILLNGVSYKPGVPYHDGSYSLLVGHFCEALGITPAYVDPSIPREQQTHSAVVLLAHPTLYVDLDPRSVVVDPWRQHTSESYTVIQYGNTRQIS